MLRVSQSVSCNVAGNVASIFTEVSDTELPNGPYVIETVNGDVFAVSRLFDDRYEAFIGGAVRPGPQDRSFEFLKIEVCCVDLILCADYLN